GQLATLLRPIATPLVMSGFETEVGDLLGGAFQDQGFIPSGGSGAGFHAGDMPYEGPLKPGDAVGVAFLTGDMQLGGTGTVTHIDGDRVYAFGHPMYNLGPTDHVSDGQRLREGGPRRRRSDDQYGGGAEDGDSRTHLGRRSAAAGRADRAAEGAAADLSRRGPAAHAADSDSSQCERDSFT